MKKNSPFKTALKLLKDPGQMVAPLAQRGYFRWMSDEAYLKFRFRADMGRRLDLEHPKSFNEKLQWLKLYDRNPEYPRMVDKYEAKAYVADIVGEEHIIPALGVYDDFDSIDFDALPERFVLKCTHDSGSIFICKDKSQMDKDRARQILERGLKRNPAWYGREWPYTQLKPRILAETYMEDESHKELKDYKFFVFSGKAEMILVDFGRYTGKHGRNVYTTDWKYMDASVKFPSDPAHQIPKPDNLQEMIAFAEKLSQGLPYVRVDLYSVEGHIYFGELTLYPGAGFTHIKPDSLERRLGDLIVLPQRRP